MAADELSKLKPVEQARELARPDVLWLHLPDSGACLLRQVLTDIFGAGPAVAVTADPNVETEQQVSSSNFRWSCRSIIMQSSQRWDRLTAASKQPHRGVDSNLIGRCETTPLCSHQCSIA